ncbi:MAG: cardiolipin synthase [Gemmataceae bacterium]
MWETLSQYWNWATAALAALDVVIVLCVIPWVLWIKKEPTSAVAWCLLVLFLPLFGAAFFVTFGYQTIYRPLRRKQKHRRRYRQKSECGPPIEEGAADERALGYEGLARLANLLEASGPTDGNAVTFYNEGRPAFDAVFAEIEKAKHHIHLQFFIYRSDHLGKRLFELLGRKAREGVEVRLLTDAVGSHQLYWWQLTDVRKAGVKVSAFLPMRLFRRAHINLRNHRKIVIVDGRVAFTGGMNVGDEYLGEVKAFGHWRDTFLRIEGPAVDPLQRLFVEDWDFSTNESLSGNRYFPALDAPSSVAVQVIASGPDQPLHPIRELLFAAIIKAKKRLWLVSPYFVPDPGIQDALHMAARTGVDVRLLIPKLSDHWLAHYAGLYFVPDMLEAGVKVYYYTKGFLHSKVVMVDGQWASVGTANLDNRSLYLNFEVNCLIHTPAAVADLEEAFLADLKDSDEMTARDLARQPLRTRLASNFCRLFAPVL